MNIEIFKDIIEQIHDEAIRKFTVENLVKADPSIATMPASTSGKYHHRDSHGPGGLVQHIRRACYFASIKMSMMKWDADSIKGDLILSALLMHDCAKKEKYENYWEYVKHAEVMANKTKEFRQLVPDKVFQTIYNCILYHMGPWTDKKIAKPLEKYTLLEFLVYECDYFSSRPDMDINPDAMRKK